MVLLIVVDFLIRYVYFTWMSSIILYEYQEKLIEEIYSAWSSGHQNILLQLATGGGKTIIFSKIMKNFTDYQIAIAHRQELLSQLSITLAKAGIYHDLLTSKSVVRNIIQLHLMQFNQIFYKPGSKTMVGSVDTLIKMQDARFDKVKQVVQDEAHHVLKENKWGKVASFFPKARGLYPTATPLRADGKGLGRASCGLIDYLVLGPSENYLINQGYLTSYKIYAPASDINTSHLKISASGDYSPSGLRSAVKQSHIVGDIVVNYLKFAQGKSGLTFVASLECAEETAAAYNKANIRAEVICGKTPDLIRAQLIQRFKDKQILQLVNVDLLGEGVDIPAIEVVTLARPTQSLAVYRQQVGRALRIFPGKKQAIIIDHVGNCLMHGLPDTPHPWSLEGITKKQREARSLLKTCLNPECLGVYERFLKKCPYCGYIAPPQGRSTPEQVEGDLIEIDIDILRNLKKRIDEIDNLHPKIPYGVTPEIRRSIEKKHIERQQYQQILRDKISKWAGIYKHKGLLDSEIYKLFYLTYGADILTVQTYGGNLARELILKIDIDINDSLI